MKKLIYGILFVFILASIGIVSKPSDEIIIKKVNEQLKDGIRKDGGDMVAEVAGLIANIGTPRLLRIEDHLLYKSVYIKYTNKLVAKAYLGCVFY